MCTPPPPVDHCIEKGFFLPARYLSFFEVFAVYLLSVSDRANNLNSLRFVTPFYIFLTHLSPFFLFDRLNQLALVILTKSVGV